MLSVDVTISPKKNIQTLYNGFQDWQPHVKKLHYEAFRVGKFSWVNVQTSEKMRLQEFGLIVLLVFRLGSSGDMIIWGSGPE